MLSRRSLLQLMGMGVAPSLLHPRSAFANTAPKRCIILFTQHGPWYDGWKMRQGNRPEDQHWTFPLPNVQGEFSQSLQPLFPFRDRTVIVDGLGLLSAEVDASGLRHELGQAHALTGAYMNLLGGVPLSTASSIDQIIASHISSPQQIPSLIYGIGEPPISVNYSGPMQLLPMTTDPLQAYQSMFGTSIAEGGDFSALQAQQIKILQANERQYDAMAQKLGADGKRKLSTHRDLIHDLSVRLEGLEERRAQCSTFDLIGVDPDSIPESRFGYESAYSSFVHLVASAFHCDLSRVATLHLGQLSGEMVLGEFVDIHNNYAHEIWIDQDAASAMTLYYRMHAEHMAQLASMLDGLIDPFGDGSQTLLDNTMIVWVGELGDGAHGFDRWPAVVVGGNGFSSFNYGQYVYHPSNIPIFGKGWYEPLPGMAQPHQKLFVSMAQQFGLDTDTIGEAFLPGDDGSTIDCRGPLEGLV